MRVKCNYCGNYIDDAEEKCPYCGATNESIKRTGIGVPKTIDELKQWYIDHHLPDEAVTRFFIGKDYAGPRAYGIFKKDSGDFVVYKNKSDGSRITRYVGADEEYAVSEIYLKLKEEIQRQKNKDTLRRSSSSNVLLNNNVESDYKRKQNRKNLFVWIFVIIIIIYIIAALNSKGSSSSGSNFFYIPGSYSSYYDSSDYDGYSSSSSSSWDSWSSSDWDSSSSWDSDWDDWDSDWGDWDSDW